VGQQHSAATRPPTSDCTHGGKRVTQQTMGLISKKQRSLKKLCLFSSSSTWGTASHPPDPHWLLLYLSCCWRSYTVP